MTSVDEKKWFRYWKKEFLFGTEKKGEKDYKKSTRFSQGRRCFLYFLGAFYSRLLLGFPNPSLKDWVKQKRMTNNKNKKKIGSHLMATFLFIIYFKLLFYQRVFYVFVMEDNECHKADEEHPIWNLNPIHPKRVQNAKTACILDVP